MADSREDFNIFDYVFETLMKSPYIREHIPKDNILDFTLPENTEFNPPYIITQLMNDHPTAYADNQSLADSYLIQIDVYDTKPVLRAAKHIRKAMETIDFGQTSSLINEFDKEIRLYRDMRRYSGIIKETGV